MELLRDLWKDLRNGDGAERSMAAALIGLAAFALVWIVCLSVVVYREIDSWSLTAGTIVSKDYHPAWTQVQTNCYPVGSSQNCQTIPIQHPESWSITIEGIDPEGVRKQRKINVSERQFEQLTEGQHYRVNE